MSRHRVAIGDRYARADTPRHSYVVVALVDKPGHPPHARLQAEGGSPYDEILVGVGALRDSSAWRRLD
ncbi:hypothetical protein J2847_006777 [Azospirillum agricola]|uniref:hypothetical protein n=1 Tax=Azospirillum agricola TaxID=1720247 RepID=UPI001AE58A85|nr:hypothetical protein [Azospirillum agricola]MBP2233439.1 hypothetical protein [Azospirillum agricola]